MENDSVKLKIHYDEEEKKFKKRYYIIFYAIFIFISIIEISYFDKDYLVEMFVIQMIFIFPFIPNFLFLKKLQCPNCKKKYFIPFLASKDEIKSLLKSNPKCVSCNFEAEIISEYKTMY